MSRSTYFFQECPTCGRTLQIRVDYLGKFVVCQHCYGKFEALDPEHAAYPATSESGLGLLQRVDELIDAANNPRRPSPR